MKNIFIGFILIFLDFKLNLGNSQIGLIPDFAGYIVMMSGLVEMSKECELFLKVKPYASGMAIYTGILYLMDLLGISVSLGIMTYILSIASTAISLYISYYIVLGVMDIEKNTYWNLNGNALKSSWTLMAIFNVITYVLILIPLVNIISIILSFIIAIYFLVMFNESKNLYYKVSGQ